MLFFKEVLPNPVGRDTEGEWVKLVNDGEPSINLAGWRFKDASGKTFSLSGTISSEEELVLPYGLTRISLNNDGDKLVLINPQGEIADEFSYGAVGEDEIVVASRFSPVVSNTSNNSNAFVGDENLVGQINQTNFDFGPILVAFALAAAFSFGIGYLLKTAILKPEERWKK